MDYCSTRKYSEYAGSTHPMTSRVGVDAVLSGGPPNRMAPNVTVVAGHHRHQQLLRYQEHQHRLAAMHSSEGLYQQQQQQHCFDRYIPSVGYPAEYHQNSFGAAAGLGYGALGRRSLASPYLNPHSPMSHHLYHPAHYDSTYSGRMIGGGGTGPSALPYHPYREGYDHQQVGAPSSILHYTAARNSAFQYGHSATAAASQQQRDYLHFYPYHPSTFAPAEQRYAQHNLHSINGLQVQSPKDDGRTNKRNGQHITESEASYVHHHQLQQQQQQQHQQLQNLSSSSLSSSSMGNTMIASPLTSGSTTTDSGISGSSRCGSTPISMVTTSAGFPGSEYSVNSSNGGGTEENCGPPKDYTKDDQESISERNEEIENGVSSTKDQQLSPNPSNIKSPSSNHNRESERTFCETQCASSRRTDCSTPLLSTPERCGTPFVSGSHPLSNFHSPHRYPYAQNNRSQNPCDTNEAPSNSPKPLSPQSSSPIPNIKRNYHPECTPSKIFEEKKNRVVECDLIPSKKSKRKTLEAEEIRESIRNIKPLPGFQQAFGSTEIGRFFETFQNIPSSPYTYDFEVDNMSPQPWEIENSGDGSQYDVQISASLQTMYKSPLGDKKYLTGIRCNGY
ncbi:la-related protein Larp4B [Eupeodes corollae]|uniref:la-related protein Larp4B n=1 Tax=Eupeodes corollae TaxID=290404 RepID=UPI002491D237|nr:la-related protein Larp4B [Eupeodes corollae]